MDTTGKYKQTGIKVLQNAIEKHDPIQYLADNAYIHSTERYKQDDLESLHEMINNFHPIQ